MPAENCNKEKTQSCFHFLDNKWNLSVSCTFQLIAEKAISNRHFVVASFFSLVPYETFDGQSTSTYYYHIDVMWFIKQKNSFFLSFHFLRHSFSLSMQLTICLKNKMLRFHCIWTHLLHLKLKHTRCNKCISIRCCTKSPTETVLFGIGLVYQLQRRIDRHNK